MIINFYKIQENNFLKTICQLIEKGYEGNYKIVVKANNHIEENEINRNLWTYSQKTFIPHGSSKDPLPEVHPIYITCNDENPNNANLKIFINNFDIVEQKFEKLLYIFNENDINLGESKALYNKYIDKGFKVSYHIQENKGWSTL